MHVGVEKTDGDVVVGRDEGVVSDMADLIEPFIKVDIFIGSLFGILLTGVSVFTSKFSF